MRRGASVVVSRLMSVRTDWFRFQNRAGRSGVRRRWFRAVERPPYRVVSRLVGKDEAHVLTVHHSSQDFPAELGLQPNRLQPSARSDTGDRRQRLDAPLAPSKSYS